MDMNNFAFWFDRTESLMKEHQSKGKQSGSVELHDVSKYNYMKYIKRQKSAHSNNLSTSEITPRVRRLQFSLINYTILIERKV